MEQSGRRCWNFNSPLPQSSLLAEHLLHTFEGWLEITEHKVRTTDSRERLALRVPNLCLHLGGNPGFDLSPPGGRSGHPQNWSFTTFKFTWWDFCGWLCFQLILVLSRDILMDVWRCQLQSFEGCERGVMGCEGPSLRDVLSHQWKGQNLKLPMFCRFRLKNFDLLMTVSQLLQNPLDRCFCVMSCIN